jgi:AcrR family transcriptional regulator
VQPETGHLYDRLLAAALGLAAPPLPVTIPSLRSVARACGVSAAAVYRHFPSQSALNRAMLTAADQAFAATVLGADDPASPPLQRLRRLGRAYLEWGLANPGLYQLRFESADRLGDDYVRGAEADRLLEAMGKLLDEWGPRRTGLVAFDLWVGIHGVVSLRIHKPALPWPADLDAQVDHLLRLWGLTG